MSTAHGQLGCVTCHGGNGDEGSFARAHIGVNPSPSADVNGICAQCHLEATETYAKSLHYSVRGFANSLIDFAGDPNALDDIHKGLERSSTSTA